MAAVGATGVRLTMVALLINAAAATTIGAYTNHTVGGASGWLFNSVAKRASADYKAWAANQTFGLGDYLIFNTNTNLTVIQTYNKTTYNSCSTDDSLDTDTFQYDGGHDEFNNLTTIVVPLTIEGTQYYFSDAEDGEQCRHGMAFKIDVGHGLGLPPSLNQPPPPPAYVPPPQTTEQGQVPPARVVAGPASGGVRACGDLNLLGLVLGVVLGLV